MTKHFLLSILAIAMATSLFGQPIYNCHRAHSNITIDGRLDDAAWLQAEVIGSLSDIRGEGTPVPRQATTIRMLYDDTYLYVGAALQEDYVNALVDKRDDIVWRDNDFEVFMDPYGQGKLYYELEVNALGTLLDLMMDRPYFEVGNCFLSWNCTDLRLAVQCEGTLNDSTDLDQGWNVEMAIPFKSLEQRSDPPLNHRVWRMNFSRVEWALAQGPEENWVWSPTGLIDIHRPAQWGYVRFIDDDEEPIVAKRVVKNWMWEGLHADRTDEQYIEHFKKAYDCGISAVLFEGYDERIYRLCHDAGLESHYWNWTLNRHELVESHPEWYAVSRTGKSCAEEPPYVGYYHFLCPTHQEVIDYLVDDFVQKSQLPYVDGMHLDYVRYPDIILPVDLWKTYGLEQTTEAPEFDFCYCDSCRHHFEQRFGYDPMNTDYPMASPAWLSFRYNAVTHLVKAIDQEMEKSRTFLSAAVFPTPDMARKMVRQDWDHWGIDAYFPMIYNGFYREGVAWIGQAVQDCVDAVQGRAFIYAGVMCSDIEKEFEQALEEVFTHGASGISLFAEPNAAQLEQLKGYMEQHGLMPVR